MSSNSSPRIEKMQKDALINPLAFNYSIESVPRNILRLLSIHKSISTKSWLNSLELFMNWGVIGYSWWHFMQHIVIPCRQTRPPRWSSSMRTALTSTTGLGGSGTAVFPWETRDRSPVKTSPFITNPFHGKYDDSW